MAKYSKAMGTMRSAGSPPAGKTTYGSTVANGKMDKGCKGQCPPTPANPVRQHYQMAVC
jgi:hypothetical protein